MKQKQQKIYRTVKGGPIRDKDVQALGERIEELMQQNGRAVTPEDIVEDAKDEDSPFHTYIAWDDRKAANLYRLSQARNIINHISVTIRYDDKETEQRAFVNVKTPLGDNTFEKAYVTIEHALGDDDMRAAMLAQAIQEVEYWKNKYNVYSELNDIFEAIKKTKSRVQQKNLIEA